jgi:hypothetical protein
MRDASRSSRNVGLGRRWTLRRQAGSSRRTKTLQRTAKSCGPGAATLALPAGACSRTTGARKAASPGRARISRKTIARGKPGCPGCTCSSTRVHLLQHSRTRDCGRSRRPAFPAPFSRRGTTRCQNLGRNRVARVITCVYPPLRAKRPFSACFASSAGFKSAEAPRRFGGLPARRSLRSKRRRVVAPAQNCSAILSRAPRNDGDGAFGRGAPYHPISCSASAIRASFWSMAPT